MTLRDILSHEPIVIAPCAYDVVTAQSVANAGYPLLLDHGVGP